MRMKSNTKMVDHISFIEQLVNQLNNLGETTVPGWPVQHKINHFVRCQHM